nr:hypothetical protein [Tanacetum cinerariifolium]
MNVPTLTRFDDQLVPVKFTLNVDLLRNALGITPKDSAHSFVEPLAGDLAIKNFFSDAANLKVQSPVHITADEYPLGNLKIFSKGEVDEVFRMPIPKDMITNAIQNLENYKKYLEMAVRKPCQPTTVTDKKGGKKKKDPPAGKYKQPTPAKQFKPVKENTSKSTPSKKIRKGKVMKFFKGKRFDHLVVEEDEEVHPSLEPQVEDDEYNLQRDPGKTLESQPLPEQELMEEDQVGPNPGQSHLTIEEHVHIENPPSSSGTLLLMNNLEDTFTFDTTVTTTTLPPPPPPLPLQSSTDPELATRVFVLEKRSADFEQKYLLQDKIIQALGSRVYTLENHDLYSKIDKQMKEISHDRIFESGSYKSHPDHSSLYQALEVSMERKNREGFTEALATSLQKSLAWTTFDSRKAPSSFSKQKPASPPEQPMEEYHLLLTDQIDLMNLEGTWVMHDVRKPLSLGGPPGQVTIQPQYFFNKDLEYLVPGDKERRHALSISKLKAAYYPEFRLEELVPSL